MSEQSMIERVARIMWGIAGNDARDVSILGTPNWIDLVPVAKAILSVMREPTEAMLRAVSGAEPGSYPYEEMKIDWQNLIDAALAE